ncbi:MAG: hypothetical protein OEZ23_01435 [Gammaproteobacteria bacterium]|nr:hypothetical protein [Gammaproteobacteria bacterium]
MPGSKGNYYNNSPKCPLCHEEVTYLGSAYDAPPFWKMSGQFFAYPFKGMGLVAMVAITICMYALAFLISTPTSLAIKIGLGLAFLAALTRYLMLIIEESSQGNHEPPDIAGFFQADPDRLFLKMVGIFFILSLIGGVIMQGSPTGGQIYSYFVFNFLLPAIIMMLAISKSMTAAINPFNLLTFILRVGLPYLLLNLCLTIVSVGPMVVMPILAQLLPPIFMMLSIGIIIVYFMFVIFRMMGYTVYQYQDVLGFTSDDDDKYYLDEDEFRRKSTLGNAHVLVQEGRFEEAFKLLQTALSQDPNNLEYHEYFHRLLLATNSVESLKEHAQVFTRLLIEKGYAIKAANHYLDAEARGVNYLYNDSDTCYQVADALYQQSKYKPALHLLVGMHKRDPDYPGLFDAYFLAAKAFIEGLSDDKKGAQLIDFIQKKFPDHSRFEEVEKYRQSLLA